MSRPFILTSRHTAILAAVKRAQPCGTTYVAYSVGLNKKYVEKCLTLTLYAQGYVDWDTKTLTVNGISRKVRVKGSLHLTKDGEAILESL